MPRTQTRGKLQFDSTKKNNHREVMIQSYYFENSRETIYLFIVRPFSSSGEWLKRSVK